MIPKTQTQPQPTPTPKPRIIIKVKFYKYKGKTKKIKLNVKINENHKYRDLEKQRKKKFNYAPSTQQKIDVVKRRKAKKTKLTKNGWRTKKKKQARKGKHKKLETTRYNIITFTYKNNPPPVYEFPKPLVSNILFRKNKESGYNIHT